MLTSPSYTPLTPSHPHNTPRRNLPARLASLALLSLPLALLILSIIIYLDPSQSMPICLPFSLARISTNLHRKISCQSPLRTASSVAGVNEMSSGHQFGKLGGYLQSQKDLFLADLREGNLRGWTVAMGNEAGDLDSLASSIAFACLSSMLHDNLSIPIALTPAPLMSLRSENLLAFELANVPISTLLHPDTLPAAPSDLSLQGAHFALVDHNKLHPAFSGGIVDAVIDHHDDEGQYMDARVRLLQVPTGSCASLVTRHFKASWQASLSSPAGNMGSPVPPELATLLLSAILIDTAGLKQGGKATATDYDSAAFLYPISSFGVEDTSASLSPSSTPPKLDQVAQRLLTAKFDVSHLSTHDLLLRDYKEYTLPTSSSSYPTLRVGLSTVPQSLKTSLEKEASGWTSYLEAVDGYMAEREVDIEGVLTTYTTEGKAKHKREILLIVRSGGAIDSTGMATAVLACLSEGLEASTELALGPWERKEFKRSIGSRDVLNSEARVGRVWEQGNTKATRKQAAPLLRDLIAKLQ